MRSSGFSRRLARIAAAALVLALGACARRDEPVVEERLFAGHRTLVVVTGGASAEARLPMVVALHWSSTTPEAMVRDFARVPVPMRILLPQAHYPRRGGWSWFPDAYYESDADTARAETFRAVDALAEWIAAARHEFPTEGRPIVTGISYGGDLAYLLAVRRPQSVRAAFPVAARFLDDWIPEGRTCVEGCPWVVAFHGDDDWVVGVGAARAAAAKLRALGYPIVLRTYAGIGHEFSAAMRADFEREIALRYGGESVFARRGGIGRG